jgi:hypothetical protein
MVQYSATFTSDFYAQFKLLINRTLVVVILEPKNKASKSKADYISNITDAQI